MLWIVVGIYARCIVSLSASVYCRNIAFTQAIRAVTILVVIRPGIVTYPKLL